MSTGLLIAGVVLVALACPLMMWLGSRGIGPGCAIMGCTPQRDEETLESLRAHNDELSRRLAALEAREASVRLPLERV
jgi:hypothetical protein